MNKAALNALGVWWECRLFRLFFVGILLGASAAGALLYFVPIVDQGRERSIISVQPNGGNLEAFHIQVPADRVFAGRADSDVTFPADVDWPEYLRSDDAQLEIFKLRNSDNQIIGVASRIAVDGNLPVTEWVLHLPARGSLYFMLGGAEPDGQRPGRMRAGTREFAQMSGSIVEQYEDDGDVGRLRLDTVLVSTRLPDAPGGDEVAMLGDSE